MILDRTHQRWCLGTVIAAVAAAIIYVWRFHASPGGLTGGSVVGLLYGIAGSALMVFAGLLSALRKLPAASWLGARKAWLRGHIWLGLLSVLFILFHSGFRWGGPLEWSLWIVLILITASGVFGLALQQFVPHSLLARVPGETPFEQLPQVIDTMRREADAIVDLACGLSAKSKPAADDADAAARRQLIEFYEAQVRPFLAAEFPPSSPMAGAIQAESAFARIRSLGLSPDLNEPLAKLASLCDERRQLAEQERLQRWLHGWLFVHVPLSAALLVLGVAHAIVAVYY